MVSRIGSDGHPYEKSGSKASGDPSRSSSFIRPESLETRMAGLVGIFWRRGISLRFDTMQSLVFWDETLSPGIGCTDIKSVQFSKSKYGPLSSMVENILLSWLDRNLISSSFPSNKKGNLQPSSILLREADIIISQSSEWSGMMSGFADGLVDVLTPALDISADAAFYISDIESSERLIRMSMISPSYIHFEGGSPNSINYLSQLPQGGIGNQDEAMLSMWVSIPSQTTSLLSKKVSSRKFACRMFARKLDMTATQIFGETLNQRAIAGMQVSKIKTHTFSDCISVSIFDLKDEKVGCAQIVGNELNWLEIDNQFRGKGYGSALLRHMISVGAKTARTKDPELKRILSFHAEKAVIEEGYYELSNIWNSFRIETYQS